jgi:hypothetical protein
LHQAIYMTGSHVYGGTNRSGGNGQNTWPGDSYGADWTEHLYTYTDNDPVNFIDPTGHYKQGDEYLSMSAQNSIHDLENRWQYANKNDRKKIEKQADDIRAQERAKKNTKINKQGTSQNNNTSTTIKKPAQPPISNTQALKNSFNDLKKIPKNVSSGVQQAWNDPNTQQALKNGSYIYFQTHAGPTLTMTDYAAKKLNKNWNSAQFFGADKETKQAWTKTQRASLISPPVLPQRLLNNLITIEDWVFGE